jgi:hypothetical protein
LHAVALAHTKPPGQGVAPPATHEPEPSQVLPVSWPPEHEAAPQRVPLGGKTHAPAELQSVAPHAPPIGLQVAVQQRVPTPDVPQMPLVHWSVALHGTPAPPLARQAPAGPGFEQ